jgi:hypothetical protein
VTKQVIENHASESLDGVVEATLSLPDPICNTTSVKTIQISQ